MKRWRGEPVIVTGPQGCGKTLAAERLRRKYGCREVCDEWWPGAPLRPGVLHLTHVPMRKHAGAVVVQFKPEARDAA